MRGPRTVLDKLYLAAGVLAAICLAAIGVLVFLQVIGRWFGLLLPSAGEFAGYLMAGSTFLALAWTLRSGGHIRVNLLIRHFSPRARRWQEAFVTVVLLALAAALTWFCSVLVLESFEFGDVSSGYVPVPLWIPQLPLPLGLGVLTVALLDELVSLYRGNSPSWRAEEGNTV